MKVVEFLVERKEERWVAGTKTVREFGEREAVAEKIE